MKIEKLYNLSAALETTEGEKILEAARKKGAVDISILKDEEKEILLSWFREVIDDIDQSLRVEMIEQFIGFDMLEDEEALGYIKNLNIENRVKLGMYIGSVIKPDKYLNSFYECWFDIDFPEEFIEEFTEKNKEAAIMAAPFCNLNKRKIRVKDYYGKENEITLFNYSFNHFDQAEKLIKAMLRLNQDHPDSRHEHHIRNNIKSIHRPFLVPYFKQLEQSGLLDRDFIDDFFNKNELDFMVVERFLSKEEEEKKKEIIQKIKDKNPKLDLSVIIYSDPLEIAPVKYGLELSEIHEMAKLRCSKNMLDNFQENKDYINDPINFLEKCQDENYSVFCSIESLGLTNEEISQFIGRIARYGDSAFILQNLEDLKIFLEFNKKNKDKDGPDLELVFVNHLKNLIIEMEAYSYLARNFLLHIDKMQPLFSSDNFRTIIDAINKEPALWIYNLNFALKNEVLPPQEILDDILKYESLFIDNYFRIISSFRKHAKEEGNNYEQKIREGAQKTIKTFPDYLFRADYSKVIADCIDETGKNDIIIYKLDNDPDFKFITKLLNSEDGHIYKKKCIEIVRNNNFLISEASEWSSDFDELMDLFNNNKEVVDIVIKNMEIVNLRELSDCHRFVRSIVNYPEKHEEFFERISETGWNSCCGNFVLKIDYMIKELEKMKKDKKNEKFNLKQRISKLKSDTKWADKLKKKEINQQIKKMSQELQELLREKDEEYELDIFPAMQSFQHDALKRVRDILKSDPFLIFDENIIRMDPELSKSYIYEHIEEYSELHPEILLTSDYYGPHKICPDVDNRDYDEDRSYLTYERLLGKEKFNILFEKHIRTLALSRQRHGNSIYDKDKLTPEMMKKISAINPLADIEVSEKLDDDYYKSVTKKIINTPFYDLFKEEIETIVDRENELYGAQLKPGRILVHQGFLSLVDRIILLNSSKLAVDNLQGINSLNSKDREEILGALEFIAFYDLDHDVSVVIDPKHIERSKEALNVYIYKYIQKSFELEKGDGYDWDNFNIEAVKALKIYYWNTCSKQPRMKENFKKFISRAVSGDYQNWRCWGDEENEEQAFIKLKEEKLIPKNLEIGQYKTWINDERFDLEEIFEYEVSDVQAGIKNILEQAVADGHIEENAISVNKESLKEKKKSLLEPLSAMTGKLQKLKNEIIALKKDQGKNDEELKIMESEYSDLQKKIAEYRKSNNDEIIKINALLCLDALKNINLNSLENNTVNISNKNISLNKAISNLEHAFEADYPDFRQDIVRLKSQIIEGRNNIFGNKRISRSKIMVTDEVDLSTYIRIGEKPVASCQHYDGNPNYNNGLLSYLTDPNVKIIQIYDDNNSIIARSIMRLLSDKDGNGVLFMERVYSSNSHRKINEIMKNFIAKKAKNMNMEWCSERTNSALYNKGSRSPYIYTDAGGGLKIGGVFRIN